jgi:hypothetical protein
MVLLILDSHCLPDVTVLHVCCDFIVICDAHCLPDVTVLYVCYNFIVRFANTRLLTYMKLILIKERSLI